MPWKRFRRKENGRYLNYLKVKPLKIMSRSWYLCIMLIRFHQRLLKNWFGSESEVEDGQGAWISTDMSRTSNSANRRHRVPSRWMESFMRRKALEIRYRKKTPCIRSRRSNRTIPMDTIPPYQTLQFFQHTALVRNITTVGENCLVAKRRKIKTGIIALSNGTTF